MVTLKALQCGLMSKGRVNQATVDLGEFTLARNGRVSGRAYAAPLFSQHLTLHCGSVVTARKQ